MTFSTMVLLSLLVLITAPSISESFSPQFSTSTSKSSCPKQQTTISRSSTQLNSENEGSGGGLFGNLFGKKEEPVDPTKPKRILTIPFDSIKPGGLRFVLGLYLIGMQGTPVKGSWKANQASDGVLDMYYIDNSAMFSVTLDEDIERAITVDRYGPTPSLQYVLQESVLLHGLLDEIDALAFGVEEGVEEENRLLEITDGQATLQMVRDTLPARAATSDEEM